MNQRAAARGSPRRVSSRIMESSMARLTPLSILIATVALLLPATSFAADRRGDEFITAMDGNSISATGADGRAFDLYFLAGGLVTYTRLGDANVSGTWQMNRDGDVCIKWPARVDAPEGCFRISFDGDTVIWRNRSVSGHGTLRGVVVGSLSKRQQ
jgi:hypothetical protein